ncbi:hypothetical protein OLMES_3886 [Oleiphilus messinensis]|uniref:PEP-CTERM protein-sorting domain-containing protein n=1 Tax=Oleiphilus messinensis TaxID=141451 RepID=A0A1Y0IDP5_9GAMM|nr:hypothetical protein [Oleiphilus messinensis]ARU57906.1 hypothetical protein OLMES_3886 [Oleiphilus messinensis]
MKAFSTVATVTTLATTLIASAATAAPIFDLTLLNNTINPGDDFLVEVRATELFSDVALDMELTSFGFNIEISEPGSAQFDHAIIAAPFVDDSSFFPSIDVAGSAFPGVSETTNQPLLLATLQFSSLSEGVFEISLSSDFMADPNQGLQFIDPFTFETTARNISASIDLSATAAIPTPPSYLLMLAGLAMAGSRVRLKH